MGFTTNTIFFFQGTVSNLEDRPMLLNVFNEYTNHPDTFLELPSSLKHSQLAFFYEPKERGKVFAKHPLFPKSFGWMTEPGIYTGE